jgi:hypothetical protein
MKLKVLRTIALSSFALIVMLPAAWQAPAQEAKTHYPSMAPLDESQSCSRLEESAAAGIRRDVLHDV